MFQDESIQCALDVTVPYARNCARTVNSALTTDLSEVDRSLFNSIIGVGGTRYVEVHPTVVVTMQSAWMKFLLKINGRRLCALKRSTNSRESRLGSDCAQLPLLLGSMSCGTVKE